MIETDREIEDQVLTALRQIARATSLYSRFIQQNYGMTVPQLVVLREVERHDGLTGGELARSVSLSQATVTGILDRLETRGLLYRERSTQDRRRVLVHVTEPGRVLLAHAPPPLQTRFLEKFRELEDWEQTLILSSLQRTVKMVQVEELEQVEVLDEELAEESLSK